MDVAHTELICGIAPAPAIYARQSRPPSKASSLNLLPRLRTTLSIDASSSIGAGIVQWVAPKAKELDPLVSGGVMHLLAILYFLGLRGARS